MRIKLNSYYIGWKTNERKIAPGIYDVNDDAIFGIADYLIRNGHAVVVEEDGAASVQQVPKPKPRRVAVKKTRAKVVKATLVNKDESE